MRRGLAVVGSGSDDGCATDGRRDKFVHHVERATSSDQCVYEFALIFAPLEILLKLRHCRCVDLLLGLADARLFVSQISVSVSTSVVGSVGYAVPVGS